MPWDPPREEGDGGVGLDSVGCGAADLRRNSERFLRISSREVTLEGLGVEREGLGEVGCRLWGGEVGF